MTLDSSRKQNLGWTKYSEEESQDLLKIVEEHYRSRGRNYLTASDWEDVATKLNAKHPEIPKRTKWGVQQKFYDLNKRNKKAQHQKDHESNGIDFSHSMLMLIHCKCQMVQNL